MFLGFVLGALSGLIVGAIYSVMVKKALDAVKAELEIIKKKVS